MAMVGHPNVLCWRLNSRISTQRHSVYKQIRWYMFSTFIWQVFLITYNKKLRTLKGLNVVWLFYNKRGCNLPHTEWFLVVTQTKQPILWPSLSQGTYLTVEYFLKSEILIDSGLWLQIQSDQYSLQQMVHKCCGLFSQKMNNELKDELWQTSLFYFQLMFFFFSEDSLV